VNPPVTYFLHNRLQPIEPLSVTIESSDGLSRTAFIVALGDYALDLASPFFLTPDFVAGPGAWTMNHTGLPEVSMACTAQHGPVARFEVGAELELAALQSKAVMSLRYIDWIVSDDALSGREWVDFLLAMYGASRPLKCILERMVMRLDDVPNLHKVSVELLPDDRGLRSSFMDSLADGPRHIARMHFWRGAEGKDYFGYADIRPTRTDVKSGQLGGRVVEASIPVPEVSRFHNGRGEAVESDGSRYPAFVIATRKKIEAQGKERSIQQAEFRQRQGIEGYCAHAAMEMATDIVNRRCRTSRLLPEDVEAVRRDAEDGVRMEDLAAALRAHGYRPMLYCADVGSNNIGDVMRQRHHCLDMVHVGIDSGIPPILSVATIRPNIDHAIVGVGHTAYRECPREAWEPRIYRDLEGKRVVRTSSSTAWVRDVLVHDEERGPYRFFPMLDRDVEPNASAADDMRVVIGGGLLGRLNAFILPMPAPVRLRPEHALARAEKELKNWLLGGEFNRLVDAGEPCARAIALSAGEEFGLIYNTVYLRGRSFRAQRVMESERRKDGRAADIWTGMTIPEHMYWTRWYSREALVGNSGALGEAPSMAEFVMDASASQSTGDITVFMRVGQDFMFLAHGGRYAADRHEPWATA
jgi:hypothetical protein